MKHAQSYLFVSVLIFVFQSKKVNALFITSTSHSSLTHKQKELRNEHDVNRKRIILFSNHENSNEYDASPSSPSPSSPSPPPSPPPPPSQQPPSTEEYPKDPQKKPKNREEQNIKSKKRPRIPILKYENDWVCVNKPAGITVHRSEETWGHKVVLSTSLKRQLGRKVYPVHRLDHRTSGAILFAFDSQTCGKLHTALKHDDTSKEYVALLRGYWNLESDRKMVNKSLIINGIEKQACTEFILLSTYKGEGNQYACLEDPSYLPACSLVRCLPKTGRRHQIRRHAYAMGLPIIGDTQHGDTKVNRWWRTHWGLDRLALHCLSLDLPSIAGDDEQNGEETQMSRSGSDLGNDDDRSDNSNESRIKCVAPLPPELRQVFERDELKEMWNEAIQKEDKLNLDFMDLVGGTYGRHYRKKQIIKTDIKEN